jgi:quinol monooxygenase YgiN
VTILVVHHRVRDFDAWKPVFDAHEPVRRDHGAQRHWVYRTADDPNDVVVALDFSSQEQASAFLEDPSLREAMRRAGVDGKPQIHFREPVETVEY